MTAETTPVVHADIEHAAGAQGAAPAAPSFLGRLTGATLRAATTAATATAGLVDQGLSAAWEVNKSAVQTAAKVAGAVAGPLVAPLEAIGVTDLVAQPVQAVTARVAQSVTGLEARGRASLADGAQAVMTGAGVAIEPVVGAVLAMLKDNDQVRDLIRSQFDWLLPALADHPALRSLVRTQVAAVLPELAAEPAISALVQAQVDSVLPILAESDAVRALIRAQGDRYIEYLNAHPAAVQTLVQGQSLSLANQVREEVRERTVTADSFIDIVVRNLLRLPPREELPPPPPDVRRRADSARLPSDFTGRAAAEPGNG